MNLDAIDVSELIGKKIICPRECGLCCLCQPEILPEERNYFRTKHSRSLVKSNDHFALAMKKGRGSCVFLDNERRCSIYDNRPTYCKQFPIHFHVSDRIKAELDLSCRGAWYNDGISAETEAKELASRSSMRLTSALREATSVYNEFFDLCKEAGVYAERTELRSSVSENLTKFTDLNYIAKVMDSSLEEPCVSLNEITPDAKMNMDELNEAAMEAALGSMQSNDPLNVPVYCDKEWKWNLFMVKKNVIEWSTLDNNGDIFVKGTADPNEISLPSLDADAKSVLQNYISTLNQRDSMMGSAFHTLDSLDYEDDMSNVYYGSLSVAIIDLMWRSSMINTFFKTGTGAESIKKQLSFTIWTVLMRPL